VESDNNMCRYTQAFRPAQGVMHVQLGGLFPNELLIKEQNLFQPLIEACTKHHCQKAVIDARDLQVEFDTVALFRAGVDAAFLNQVGLRVAFVARAEMVSSFFNDVTHNRGGLAKIFTDMESASAWINASHS
jgi:hypothetical protein